MPRRKKPTPPIERFPTIPRKDGRFQKRIRGRLFYFGRDGDRASALAEYELAKYALYDGRSPAQPPSDPTVAELCYRLLDEKLADARADRIEMATYHDYVHALKRFARYIGTRRNVSQLRPDDFAAFARHLRGKLGPFAYNRERAHVVAMFNHAVSCDWIDRPIKLGKGFRKASAAELRDARTVKLVPRGVVQQCVRGSDGQLRAMILLAALGGYGAGDCAALTWDRIDLDKRMIRFPRPKTGIARDTPMPIETVEAIKEVRADRPRDTLVFRTRLGNPWVRYVGKTHFDAIAGEWQKLQATFDQPERFPFYALRHTFATHANATKDRDAVRRIMGHALSGLDDVYVETIMRERLFAVVDHVRSVLLPAPEMVYA